MLTTQEEIYYTVIIITAFAFLFVAIIITAAVLYYNRRRAHLSEKAQFAQQLLQSQLEIREQTLRDIGQELHDNLGQIASLIKINLNTLVLTDVETSIPKLAETKDLTRQLIADIKALSVSLNSHRVVHHGLYKSLDAMVERLKRTGQFEVGFTAKGSDASLDANTSIIVFRMVQEVLNNMTRHSGATSLQVSAEMTDNMFTLVCADNGVGFDVTQELSKGAGSGLMNLQNRAKLVNGSIQFNSVPGQGTTAVIKLLV